MFPVIFSLGPFVLRTLNIFLILALVLGLFVFWRKGREEHYDETVLFDGVFLSLLFGLILARIVFIITNWAGFADNPIAWIDIFAYPGFSMTAVFAGSFIFLYRFAQKRKWDVFEILDFWSIGVAMAMIFIWLGFFFDGVAFGIESNLPIALQFPTVFTKHHPTQLYFAAWYMLVFWYITWAEYRYRTFSWYRSKKNTAQTGYLVSVFLIMTSFFSLIMTTLTYSPAYIWGVRLDVIVSVILLLAGLLLLFTRSGRSLFFWRQKQTHRPHFEDF